jgi:hypothetical protein
MTAENKRYIKTHWITFANLILLLGIVVQQSRWQQSVDNRLEAFEEHRMDREMHMPIQDRIQLFVPRVELDNRLNRMEDALIKIDNKIDRLNK